MKKIISLVFMFISCIGIYAQQIMDATAAYKKANDLLERLTIEEKALMVRGYNKFFIKGFEEKGILPIYLSDATQGVNIRNNLPDPNVVKQLERSTAFPSPILLASTFSPDLSYQYAKAIGEECRAGGIEVLLGPGLNIYRQSQCARNFEYFGEDPYLVGELGKQMITSLQKHNLVATPKHFAVYSIPVGGRDGKTRTDPHVAPREMRTLYIEPFRMAFQEAGALGVMSSYNDYDGEPITGSYHFLTEILRQEWGFKGYVVSDSEAVEFISSKHKVANTYEDGIAQAVNAGLNIRTHFTPPADFILPLRKAVADGKISQETLDKRVAEILRVKFWLGLFDNPYRGNGKQAEQIVHSKEHQAVSLEAARQSLVLLKILFPTRRIAH